MLKKSRKRQKRVESVKKDIISVSGWIKHLDSQKYLQQKDIEQIKQDIASIFEEIEGKKNVVSIVANPNLNKPLKQTMIC
jgi:argininosuccinate lyase